jgi:RNase P subunit RPR2
MNRRLSLPIYRKSATYMGEWMGASLRRQKRLQIPLSEMLETFCKGNCEKELWRGATCHLRKRDLVLRQGGFVRRPKD